MGELMAYLPEDYSVSRETTAFQRALQPEVDGIWAERDDLLAQLNPTTATWGLIFWEAALGLSAAGHLETELRRASVLAKLNVRGICTVPDIRNLVKTITGRDGDVIEHFRQYAFTVWVMLLGGDGTAVIRELIRQIEEVKPAHLTFDVAASIRPAPFSNRLERFVPHRLGLSAAFNSERPPVVRFNGKTAFDGGCPFNWSPAGLASTGLAVHTRFREPCGGLCGTLVTGGYSVLDGSVPLDGSVRLNTSLIREDL